LSYKWYKTYGFDWDKKNQFTKKRADKNLGKYFFHLATMYFGELDSFIVI